MALHKPSMKRVFSAAFQVRFYSAPATREIPGAKQKYVPTSGTYPKGFLAGSSHAGVKASNTQYDDVALVVSEKPCSASAVFTRNLFRAAPVSVSKKILYELQDTDVRGVVVNSGCANAVTGHEGRTHALDMAKAADQCFALETTEDEPPRTLVMSTGVIGQKLPIDRITEAIPKAHAALGSTHDHWMRAAQAICTTDTFPKLISRTFTLPSHPDTEYRIAGMTKGAGMIHPNMGTLLGIICTDANIVGQEVYNFLKAANNNSFNCISIDGDTSTNDTVALFANGAAAPSGTPPLQFPRDNWTGTSESDSLVFYKVLRDFMQDLAKLVVRDGEGATKFVTVQVQSTTSMLACKRAAASIATSSLVKTALYGKDANWGRILCAIGYAPGIIQDPARMLGPEKGEKLQVLPDQTSVSFFPADGSEQLDLLVKGDPQEVDEARAKEILEMEDLWISVKLNDTGSNSERRKPPYEARYWTCDLSHEYVTINGDYRT